MGKHNKSGSKQKGQVAFLGIDLSKKSFQLHGVDAKGKVVIKKKLNRKALLPFIANLPECVIGIEAWEVWGQVFICASLAMVDDICYAKRKT